MRSIFLGFGLASILILPGCGSQTVELGEGPVEKEVESALFAAIGGGKLDTVKREISQNEALLNQTEGRLVQTPLHKAVRTNQLEIAQFLVERGAAINTRDAFNRTPLAVAMDVGASAKLIEFLKGKGADD